MRIELLDHGYIEFIEAWGHGNSGERDFDDVDFEAGIICAARQSTQGSFRGWQTAKCDMKCADEFLEGQIVKHDQDCASRKNPGDMKLLSYLYRNNHATPFEFAGMVIEVQAPIFVFREWQRHRTQSYNEMSARYEPLPDLYYVPTVERLMMKQEGNRQALGTGEQLTEESARTFLYVLKTLYEGCEETYKQELRAGIPKELARCVMPVGHYSRMRASANLRNWLAFLTLRMDPKAQYEIRVYAEAVSQIIAEKFPRTHQLFSEA